MKLILLQKKCVCMTSFGTLYSRQLIQVYNFFDWPNYRFYYIISKLDRHISILTHLATSGQNGSHLSFAVPCTTVHGAALF